MEDLVVYAETVKEYNEILRKYNLRKINGETQRSINEVKEKVKNIKYPINISDTRKILGLTD